MDIPIDLNSFSNWQQSLEIGENAIGILTQLLNEYMEKELNKKKKKRVKETKTVVLKEDIDEFKEEIEDFQIESIANAKNFKNEGMNTLKKLEEASNHILEIAKEYEPEQTAKIFSVAQKLNHVVEYGGLQSLERGQIWQKLGIGYFNVGVNSKQILNNADFTKEELLPLFDLLTIGKPSVKNKESLIDALVNEISIRANTR